MMKPKFNIGNTVWYIENNKAVSAEIFGIALKEGGYASNDDYFIYSIAKCKSYSHSPTMLLKENDLFISKEELIASL